MDLFKRLFSRSLRYAGLCLLFIVFFMIGSAAVADLIPKDAPSEPGLVPTSVGLLIIALVNLLVLAALIRTSRWSGWKLALSLAAAYYGVTTVLTQIETWYFLSSITVEPLLLPRLFLMGLPTAFLFVPAAVWVLGKGRSAPEPLAPAPQLSARQWIWKTALLGFIYLVLYWTAGYFIAWRNPELRAFYGSPGEALPFFAHTLETLKNDPMLFPLQFFRGLLWILCALPIILGSQATIGRTALLTGLFFSVPQNVGHILANPLMPVASVRLSHMIETASSTFLYGVLVVLFLYRPRRSLGE
ncbi:MAG: hypothetical protein ONA69_09835 [candidate division KSB1 bacterium]|nr:hypothetical protein [candidate division KSB1 bacterium]MDZ7347076.1 hypothetical protein [candidate division KSB1 bacterium]